MIRHSMQKPLGWRGLGFFALLLAVLCWATPGLAQITIRATAQAGVPSGNLILDKPAGTSTGDVLVAVVSVVPGDRTVPAPTGWLRRSHAPFGSGIPRLALFTRVVTAADATVTSYTFTFGGGAHSGAAGGIVAFVGVDTASLIDGVPIAADSPAGFAHTASSISTTARGATLLTAFSMSGSTANWSPPAGMLEQIDVTSVASRPAAGGVALSMSSEFRPTPGSTGTRTATAAATGISAAAGHTLTIALRPLLAPARTHYRLDGGAGTMSGTAGEVLDSGGTGLHGLRRTLTAPTTTNFHAPSPTIHGQHAAVSGQFCNAARFDGQAVLEVPASPLFDYTNEFSASAWIFPTAAPTGGGLFSVLSNDQNYELHLDSSQRLFWWWGGGVRSLTSDAPIALNRWTHIAITFRSVAGSARQRIYIDGELDEETNWIGTLTPNGCNFYIGGDVETGAGCVLIPGRAFRGSIDEVKLYNFELSEVEVNRDRTLGRTCLTAISRYRIEHDGSAHSCAAESITIRACANADCSELSNAGADGTLVAGGNSVPFNIPVGQNSTTVSLLMPTTTGPPDPEIVRLAIGSASPAAALAASCRNGAGTVNIDTACDVTVTDANFAVEVPDHIADTQPAVTIRALRRDGPGDPSTACTPLFANVTRSVGFWATYADPASGTLAVTLGGSALGNATPGTPQSLSFNASGVATTVLRYADAGALRLHARYSGSSATGDAGLVVTGEDRFVARPARFQLTIANHNAGPPSDATRPVFGVAGVPFAVTAQALNASGAPTPNFGREATPESVRFESVLQAPLGGLDPPPVAAGFTAWANGASTGTVRFDEVGVITLRPRLASAPYLDFAPSADGDVVGADVANVGRFRPARLAVAPNVPQLLNACAAGGFGYMGQEFGFATPPELTVTGFNALGSNPALHVTRNYNNGIGAANAFWRFGGALTNRSYTSTATSTLATFSRTTNGGTGVVSANAAPAFDGEGRVTVNGDRFTWAKPALPEDPFTPQFALALSAADLTDSDGVCFDTAALDGCDALTITGITGPAGSQQRWGRIALTSAFGPELLDLQLPMRAEFFNGTAFVANPDDVCSAVIIAPLIDANPADSLLPTETCVQDSGSPGTSGQGCSVAGPLADRRYTQVPPTGGGGRFVFWLRAPGAGNAGILDVIAMVPSFLQFNWQGSGPSAPRARVGFGVFQGDRRAIHTREVY